MTFPNFLIIGAGKSGTTSLYAYLAQHPQIYMSPAKEPGYFAFAGQTLTFSGPGDAAGINRSLITDESKYCALFERSTDYPAVGEASPLYLHVPQAAARIRAAIPDCKLIAILRNPIDRAYSDYLYRRNNGNEPEAHFLSALQLESARIQKGWSPYCCYIDKGRYSEHLRRFYDLFPPSQIRLYLYEDLQHSSSNLLHDLFGYLNVESGFKPDMRLRYSASGTPRSELFQGCLNFVKKSRALRSVRSQVSSERRYRIYTALQSWNLQTPPTIPVDAEAYLIDMFTPEIESLARLVNRDLSHWTRR
jgi:hypothetical protein